MAGDILILAGEIVVFFNMRFSSENRAPPNLMVQDTSFVLISLLLLPHFPITFPSIGGKSSIFLDTAKYQVVPILHTHIYIYNTIIIQS